MKWYLFAALAACAATGAAFAEAIPLGSNAAPDLSLPVASGCGLGVHRGPFDGCEPVYGGAHQGYDRGYRNNFYIGYDRGGVCGGRGTHLACNFYGICWVACN